MREIFFSVARHNISMPLESRKFSALLKWCLLGLLATVSVATRAQSKHQVQPKSDPALGDRIAEGIVFEGKLWLRGTTGKDLSGETSGALVSLSLVDQSRQAHFERGVLDIEMIDGALWVLRRLMTTKQEFVLSVWRSNAFQEVHHWVSSENDAPIGFVKEQGALMVLCQKSIKVFEQGGSSKSISLKGEIREGVQTAIVSPVAGGSAYVGVNRGEWGGGLQRIDLRTGEVSNVERRDNKNLCSGPLNRDCDPVTGVIADPRNKECVLSAIGLVHLLSHGRILRVCGEQVSVIFENPESYEVNGRKLRVTEPFFGLAAASRGFWAIAPGTLYYFADDGKNPEKYPIPKLKPVSGVWMSRELPGVVIIRTDVNWAVSVSGYTPLVIELKATNP